MNITAQHVAPEEVMAFLDGELSTAEAKAVSAHIEDCAECAPVAERLRRASQALSAWKVPAIPAKVEDRLTDLAAKAASGVEIGKPRLSVRASFWGWKQWAGLTAGALSALLFIGALFMPSGRPAMSVARRQTVPEHREVPLPMASVSGAGGNRD